MNHITPKRFSAVIFDLDGTLLDTLEDIAASLNEVLAQHGYPTHSLDACRQLVGFGMEALVSSALPEPARNRETVATLLPEMKAAYSRQWNDRSRPFDGIDRLLDAIDRLGIKKAVLSNKPDEFTRLCVEELLDAWRFDVVMGHHDGIPHKPAPEGALLVAKMLGVRPQEILYVGDSGIDMQTAAAAGMFPLGVLWGFRPADELLAKGALRLAETADEIIGLLEQE